MKFLRLRPPKGIITRSEAAPIALASASVSSLDRELRAARSKQIPDERGDHARLLQPRELALVTACAKAPYF